MNILQILTEGTGLALGPVEVIKDYGVKNGQTPHRAIHVKDPSGSSTFVKIWGPESSKAFNPGDKFSVQAQGSDGTIAVSEYNGKKSLNCNNCLVTADGAGQPAAQPAAAAPANMTAPAPSMQVTGSSLNPEQLADAQVAHFARVYKRLQTVEGISSDALVNAAALMTGSASDWWFGAKYPGCGS